MARRQLGELVKLKELLELLFATKNLYNRIHKTLGNTLTDRAGTDPVRALTTMPLTILSILGLFYAVSAAAVLAYKYTLLTAGSDNGQAVALLPVIILFSLPLVAAVVRYAVL